MPAPIALFVYNRPWHTQQTVEALKQNELASQTDLLIFSDGAKSEHDRKSVNEVRDYIKTVHGFNSVYVFESKANKGLSTSIIDGVTSALLTYNDIIVVEDDLVTSPHFLSYMNQALDLYRLDNDVVCINAYMYPTGGDLPETFFIRGADCQGWATWSRGWSVFNPDGRALLQELKRQDLIREFNYNNSHPFSRMLYYQQKGMINSWAIRWYASAFLANKLTLYPSMSLLKNIGFDNTGSNSSNWDKKRYDSPVRQESIHVKRIATQENREAREILGNYFKRTRKPLYLKIRDKIKSFLRS